MNADFIEALNTLEKDRGISKDVLIETIQDAVLAAYKKNYGPYHNVRVLIDPEAGELMVLMRREIVETVSDSATQMSLEEAHEIDSRYQIGDYIEYQVMPKEFGRVAAQTAKQVVVQRIREKERELVYDRYISYLTHIITGRVHRKTARTIFVSLDGTEGVLPHSEQMPGENFKVGDIVKAYVFEVKKSYKGPQVFLSRSHPGFIRRLFELEIPEIEDGIVSIVNIAREAGSRTKITVTTDDENVDPIGACVGNRGLRVQHIADEIHGEKIDIIEWSDNPEKLIANVLSPAKVSKVMIHDMEEQVATVVVPDYQLSLAIGREGQNVRLAARVSGWKIDIKSETQYREQFGDFEQDDYEYYDAEDGEYSYENHYKETNEEGEYPDTTEKNQGLSQAGSDGEIIEYSDDDSYESKILESSESSQGNREQDKIEPEIVEVEDDDED